MAPTMIRVGVGGWTFEPWRGTFYPPGLRQADELAYASRHLTSIEINSTFYRTQTPASFRKWADQTPDDFVFSVKGPRDATNRTQLAGAGPSIERFFTSGVTELGPKLGPVVWQLPPSHCRRSGRLRLRPPHARGRERADRLCATSARGLGGSGRNLGRGRRAERPAACRLRERRPRQTARLLRLFHQRREGAQSSRCDGLHRAAQGAARSIRSVRRTLNQMRPFARYPMKARDLGHASDRYACRARNGPCAS